MTVWYSVLCSAQREQQKSFWQRSWGILLLFGWPEHVTFGALPTGKLYTAILLLSDVIRWFALTNEMGRNDTHHLHVKALRANFWLVICLSSYPFLWAQQCPQYGLLLLFSSKSKGRMEQKGADTWWPGITQEETIREIWGLLPQQNLACPDLGTVQYFFRVTL